VLGEVHYDDVCGEIVPVNEDYVDIFLQLVKSDEKVVRSYTPGSLLFPFMSAVLLHLLSVTVYQHLNEVNDISSTIL